MTTTMTTTNDLVIEADLSKQDREAPTILCVDDDPDISQSIKLRLREFHVNVERCFNGMQGIWEAVTRRPDLIISDLAMPNGDGQSLLGCLKRNRDTASIPVIVLSGMSDKGLAKTVFANGAAQFLSKPLVFDDLFHEIGRHIDLQRREVCEGDV